MESSGVFLIGSTRPKNYEFYFSWVEAESFFYNSVELNEKFGFSTHIKHLIIKAWQSFYSFRVLRLHGLPGTVYLTWYAPRQ